MKVKQLSIFLENKAGRLAEVTKTLADASVNILALSLADTSDFGILRMIVDKHDLASDALKQNSFTVGTNTVIIAEVPHKPGGLNTILQYFSEKNVNVEYMYAFVQASNDAVMVFRCSDEDLAIETLQKYGIKIVAESSLC